MESRQSYTHTFVDGSRTMPPGKVVCVGRNYLEHARELGNPVPSEPILFMKPATALVAIAEPIRLPAYSEECHHEVEVAVLLDQRLYGAAAADVLPAVAGYGLALDLTLRDVQKKLKEAGHPWERAKSFDDSCPLSPFVPRDKFSVDDIDFSLSIDGQLRQRGNTNMMMVGICDLIAHISRFFTLLPGDVVLTGTPSGVGPLAGGDELVLELGESYRFGTRVL